MIRTLYVGRVVTRGPDGGVTERGERVAFCRFHAAKQTWLDGSTTEWGDAAAVRVEHDYSCQFLAPQDLLKVARSFDRSARLLDPDPFAPAPETPAAPETRPEQGALALSFADPTLPTPPVRRTHS